MTDINKKLKKYEERLERVIEDPEKLIQIIHRIIVIAYPDTDGTFKVTPPVPDEKKVTLYEFVKYFANFQIERAEESGWDVEQTKREWEFAKVEQRIRAIGGFSDDTLPDGFVRKY